jgi:hypothetical protein
MESTKEILSDEQIDSAWGNANFGKSNKRDIIVNALLEYTYGYETGHTIKQICEELGLVTNQAELTTKGERYLFVHFSGGLSV